MVALGGFGAGMAGGAAVTIVIQAVDRFSAGFAKATTASQKLGKAMNVMAIGTAIAFAASVKHAAKYETELAKVNTLLDEGQNSQKLFNKYIQETAVALGNAGGQTEIAAGLYQTISAGITDVGDAQKFMTVATKAAVGGFASLPTVIKTGTKTIAAFGLKIEDTERVFDAFAATVKAGQTNMEELAEAFPQVAGLAGEMGVSLEETLGVFAGLTKILKDSNMTATGMKAIFTQLLKPQEDLQAGLRKLGFETGAAAIESLGLMGTLNALKESVDGDTDALGKMFGNVRAITSVLPAVGAASDDIADSLDVLKNSAGLTEKQFADMSDTMEVKLNKLKNNFKSIADSLAQDGGLLDVITSMVEGLETFVKKFNDLPEAQKANISKGIVAGGTALMAGAAYKALLGTSAATPMYTFESNPAAMGGGLGGKLTGAGVGATLTKWGASLLGNGAAITAAVPLAANEIVKTSAFQKLWYGRDAWQFQGGKTLPGYTDSGMKQGVGVKNSMLLGGASSGLISDTTSAVLNGIAKNSMLAYEESNPQIEEHNTLMEAASELTDVQSKILTDNMQAMRDNKEEQESLTLSYNRGEISALEYNIRLSQLQSEFNANALAATSASSSLDGMTESIVNLITTTGQAAQRSGLRDFASSSSGASMSQSTFDALNATGGFGSGAVWNPSSSGNSGTIGFNDFISRPGQATANFSPDDTIIGMKNPGRLMGSSSGQNIDINIENIYGTDPDEMAEALQAKLRNMVNV